MNNIREVLRLNLEHQLKKSGLTQKQLAEKLKISPSAVTNWIKGKNSPDIEYVALICEIFQITISDLLDIQPTKKAPTESLGESDFQKRKLLHNYDSLNPLGKEKLTDYSDDLKCNPKYTDADVGDIGKKQA